MELQNYYRSIISVCNLGIRHCHGKHDRLCGLVVRVPGYRSGGPGFDSQHYKKISGCGTGSTQPREYN
jgi:hypothetical protein